MRPQHTYTHSSTPAPHLALLAVLAHALVLERAAQLGLVAPLVALLDQLGAHACWRDGQAAAAVVDEGAGRHWHGHVELHLLVLAVSAPRKTIGEGGWRVGWGARGA